MGVFSSIEDLGKLAAEPVVLAIGMFDGVHRGHQSVINSAVLEASSFRGRAVALTFTQHPASFLRPGSEPPLIMNPETKAHELMQSGVSDVILRSFDQGIAGVKSFEFVDFLKKRVPSLKAICVGKNFRFGKDRVGDWSILTNCSQKIDVEVRVAESMLFLDQPVSSSRIRSCLAEGSIEFVNQMLGRNYIVDGTVSRGKAIGRTIGFPTLNIFWNPQACPAFGVYVGIVENVETCEKFPAVANYGVRPTVENNTSNSILEIHVLTQEVPKTWGNGSKLKMELINFIRQEKKFSSLEELKIQIEKDKKKAEQISRFF